MGRVADRGVSPIVPCAVSISDGHESRHEHLPPQPCRWFLTMRLLLRVDESWVVEDLPEVSVEIAKVAGVDPPWTVVRSVGERGSGVLGLGEQRVDLGLARDRVSDAELACLRRTERNLGVLRELGARVERQHQPARQLEQHDSPGRLDIVAGELTADHPARLQSEAVSVELECPLQIGYSERDDVDSRFHLQPCSLASRAFASTPLWATLPAGYPSPAQAVTPQHAAGTTNSPSRRYCARLSSIAARVALCSSSGSPLITAASGPAMRV